MSFEQSLVGFFDMLFRRGWLGYAAIAAAVGAAYVAYILLYT